MRQLLKLLFFTAFIVITIFVAVRSKDEKPPNDADLVVTRLVIPPEENAFTYFNSIIDDLYYPDDEKNDLKEILADKQWNPKLANEIVKKNEKAFKNIEKGLECSQFQVPEIKDMDTKLPYLGPWRRMGTVMLIRSKLLYKEGKQQAALDQAIQVIQFGHRIEDSGGSIIHYLVGMAIKRVAFRQIETMLMNSTLPPDYLSNYSERISKYTVNKEGLSSAFKTEYALFCKVINDMLEGKFIKNTKKSTFLKKKKLSFFYFQPNKTKRIYADYTRSMIENIYKPYSEIKTNEAEELEKKNKKWLLSITPNAAGNIMLSMFIFYGKKFQRRKCAEDMFITFIQLIIACKCYKIDHGHLPVRLEELVPKYIQQIPLDPFDGKPMRYSAENKIIYSVGADLKDSNGSEKIPPGKTLRKSLRRWEAEDIVAKID